MSTEKSQYVTGVFDRLMEIAEVSQLDDLADFLGMKYSTVRNRKSRDSIPYENIVSKLSTEELGYVLKGDIDRKRDGDTRYKIMSDHKVNDRQESYSIKKDEEFYTVPFYASVKASAGGGIVPQEKDPLEIAFRKYFVNNTLNAQAKDLFAMMIDGDSMEPTLQHDDLVLIDQSKRTPRAGHIMVIRTDETVSCKRIQELPGRRLSVMSDNEAYDSYEVTADQEGFEIIGTVIWYGRSL